MNVAKIRPYQKVRSPFWRFSAFLEAILFVFGISVHFGRKVASQHFKAQKWLIFSFNGEEGDIEDFKALKFTRVMKSFGIVTGEI